jgi:vanillin dehydrogenase
VRVAGDIEYGLSSAVFSRYIKRAMGAPLRVEADICHVSGPTVHHQAQIPSGGMKASGCGRFGGTAAIHEFAELCWITAAGRLRNDPIWAF